MNGEHPIDTLEKVTYEKLISTIDQVEVHLIPADVVKALLSVLQFCEETKTK